MATLSKRNKIILVTGGLIVVLAAAVAIFSQQGGAGLFGSGVRTITPANPTMTLGLTGELVVDAVWGCDWTSSDLTIVSFATDPNNTKAVTVQANACGQATIKAQCAGGTHGTTLVSVLVPITPHGLYIDIFYERYKTLSTGNPRTRWTLSDCGTYPGRNAADLVPQDPDGSHTGPSVGLSANFVGDCTVIATTDGMADSITFYVQGGY
jgi:hypothetical protein